MLCSVFFCRGEKVIIVTITFLSNKNSKKFNSFILSIYSYMPYIIIKTLFFLFLFQIIIFILLDKFLAFYLLKDQKFSKIGLRTN